MKHLDALHLAKMVTNPLTLKDSHEAVFSPYWRHPPLPEWKREWIVALVPDKVRV